MIKKNKCLLTLSLLFVFCLLGACGEKEYTDVDHINRAMDFYDLDEMPSAVIELKNALAKNTENAEARWLLGKIYVELGAGAEAEKELQKAIDLGLVDSSIYLKLYESYLLQGKHQQVVDALVEREYLESKTLADAYILLGRANLGLGKQEKAREWFVLGKEKGQKIGGSLGLARIAVLNKDYDLAARLVTSVLAEAPQNIGAHHLAGQIYTYEEDYVKAIESFNFIVEKRPRDLYFRLGRAEVLLLSNKFEQAENDAQFALKTNQNIPLAHFTMAKIFYGRDDLAAAQTSLEKVIRGLPNHLPSFYMLGVIHFRQGNLEQSVYYLDKFLSFVKGNPEAEKLMVENYIKMGRPAEAVPLLEHLVSLKDEPDVLIMTALGEAYLYTGEPEKAIGIYTKAVSLWPTKSFLQARLAVAYLYAGDKDNAISKLVPLVDVTDVGKAHILLVNTYLEKGEVRSALNFANSLVEKDSNIETSHFVHGYTLARTGAFDEAIEAYERAIRINPSFTPALLGLAEIFVFNKQFDLAKETYKRVLAIDDAHYSSFLGMAQIEHYQNNLASASDLYSKAAKVQPKNIEPIRGLVQIDILEGRALHALNKSNKFVESWPENVEGQALMAISLISNGKDAAAETHLRRYIAEKPENIFYRALLVDLLFKADDFDGALKATSAILRDVPDHKPSLQRKINILVSMRRFNEARQEINKLGALAAGLNLDRMIADTYVAEGRFKESVPGYKAAYAVEPSRQILNHLVGALLKSGDSAGAIEVLSLYLDENPGDVAVRLTQANLYSQLGDTDKAVASFQLVLTEEPDNTMALNNLAWMHLDSENGLKLALKYAEQAYKVAPKILSASNIFVTRSNCAMPIF